MDNYIDQSYRFLYDSRLSFSFDEIKENPVASLKAKIDQDYYIFTYTDKYHISTNGYYHRYHFVHPLMVIGYDDAAACMICIDFDPRHGPVKISISYDEFTQAFLDCQNYNAHGAGEYIMEIMAVCIRINQSFIAPVTTGRRRHAHYAFNLERFTSELHNYLYGVPCSRDPYEPFQYQVVRVVYGMRTYDELLRYFDLFVENGQALRFKVLHDFVLHKWMLLQRLNYICSRYQVSEACRKAVEAYNNVYHKAEHLRLLNLKYNIRDRVETNSLSLNPKFVESFRSIIPEIRDEEAALLHNIYNELNRYAALRDVDSVLYSEVTRTQSGKDEIVALHEPQALHRIEIVFPQNTSDDLAVNLLLNGTVYSVLPEHIRRGHAVIDIYPIQMVKEFRTCSTNCELYSHLQYRLHTRSRELTWDFNGNWFVSTDLESDLHIDRSISATIHGRDPSIWMKQDFFAKDLKYLHFRYRTDCQSNIAEVIFTNDDGKTSRKCFAVAPMDNMYEHILDMSDNPDWKGRIQMVRFDPISYDSLSDSGKCEIDSIKLSSQLPVYDSQAQFAHAQGLNGWSYHTFNDESTYREMIIDDDGIHARNHACVYIDADTQSSANHLASVRIWTCPADGEYHVKYSVRLLTDGNKCKVYMKHNHRKVFVAEKELVRDHIVECEETFLLERGETLRFEFYNHDQDTVETAKMVANIAKMSDLFNGIEV